jgi:hypothetical protein
MHSYQTWQVVWDTHMAKDQTRYRRRPWQRYRVALYLTHTCSPTLSTLALRLLARRATPTALLVLVAVVGGAGAEL